MSILPTKGPIPKRGTPGVDLDGEWCNRRTDTGLGPYSEIPVLFHHGRDPLRFLRDARLGTATGWRRNERGWTCEVTLASSPQVEPVQHLADRIELYASTSTAHNVERDPNGHIRRWHVSELSLSPAPQNLFATIY